MKPSNVTTLNIPLSLAYLKAEIDTIHREYMACIDEPNMVLLETMATNREAIRCKLYDLICEAKS